MRITGLTAMLAVLVLSSAAMGAVLHISPQGDDDAAGTPQAPIQSLARLQNVLAERADVTEVVFHDGVYPGALTVPAPRGEGEPPHLLLRAADGATPVLDGAVPLDADRAEPVEGMPNVYRFDGAAYRSDAHRQRGQMPPLWDEPARVRYALVADARAVGRVRGAYTFAGDFLYLQTNDGRHPAEHSIEVGRLEFASQGLLVQRSNVTVRGLTARNYSVGIHSAGFLMASGTENVTFEECRAFNCSRGFRVRGRHGRVLNCFADDVGCGTLVNGHHVLVEGSTFLRGPRDAFMIPMPRQEDTGIEVYFPASEEITVRGNTAKGFTFCGVFLKSRPGTYHVVGNTLVGNAVGVGWDSYRGRRVFVRDNILLGNERPMSGPTDQTRVFHRAYGNLAWPAPWAGDARTRQNVEYMNTVGENNLMADPRLAAPEADDFRLLPGSPALDRLGPGQHAGAHGPVPADFRDVQPPLLDLSRQPALTPVEDAEGAEQGTPPFSASRREFPLQVRAHDSAGQVAQMRLRVGDGPWGEPMPYAETATIRLPADEGEFAVQARVADDAGNWSEPTTIRVQAAVAAPRLVGEPTVRANRYGVAVSFRTNVECFASGTAGPGQDGGTPLLAAGTTRPGARGAARREHVLALLKPEGAQEGSWQYRVSLSARRGDAGQEFSGTFRFEGEPKEFFVAEDGEDVDEGGTAERPWRTIQYAADRALPGDRVTVRSGLYFEGVRITRGGAEGAPLAIAAAEKWGAVLDGQRRVPNMIHLDSSPYVELSGLEVRWYGDPRGAGIRLDNSPECAVRECRIWNAFWFMGRADGHGVRLENSPGFVMERSLLYRQDWAMVIRRSPGSRLEHNTFRGHVHGGLNITESVAGMVFRNNSHTYYGNYAFWIRVRDPQEMETFDSDYNNLGTRIRHWRDEPGVAPNLGWSWGGSKTIAGYMRTGGTFIRADPDAPTYEDMTVRSGIATEPLRRDIHAPDEEGWEGPPGQRFKWLANAETPVEERGCRYALQATIEDWREFFKVDENSIFAEPEHWNLVEFDFRLHPDSPNVGAGEDGTTIGALPAVEPGFVVRP